MLSQTSQASTPRSPSQTADHADAVGPKTNRVGAMAARTTRYRFWVLALLCSLAFLTYLDRICIMRVQGDIEHDLGFTKLTQADEQWLRERSLERDLQARAKIARDRATERMSWVFAAFVAGYV